MGQCQVSATSAEREGFREGTVQTIVTVTDKPVPEISWQGYDSREAAVGEPAPGVRRPTATVDGRSVRLEYTFEVDEDSERDGICDVNTRSGQINALAAGTCIVIAKSAETDDYAAAESDPVRIPITKEKLPPELEWDGYGDDAENLRAGDDRIDPIEPEPGLREARGKLTYTYSATPRAVCSVDPKTGDLRAHREGTCDVTVRSAETDDFLADEVMVDVTVLGERGDPDLDWFRYRDSPTAGGNAIMPDRPSSRDRVGPLRYQSETPNTCRVDSRSGSLSGRKKGTCRVTVTSARTNELLEGSETIHVEISDLPLPDPCTLRYSSGVNVGEQVGPRIDCGDGDRSATYETETPRICDVDPDSGDVRGLVPGQCRITATVPKTSSYSAATARATLPVDEDRSPECDAIGDIRQLDSGQDARPIRLDNYCEDPEEERLRYTAESDDRDIATVRISGSSLIVTAAHDGDGTTTITVTAEDPGGQTDTTSFHVTVEGNQPPERVGSISNITLDEDESETITVSSYFRDPDRDSLSYSAESDDRSTVSVSVSRDSVTVERRSPGSARITVTADDGNGGTATQTFTVTVERVNQPPERVGSISNITLDEGDDDDVTVSSYFRDPDRDSLSYSAESDDRSTVSVSVSRDSVAVEGRSPGSARITVTADDGNGGTATQTFSVTVREEAPVINSISCSPSRPEVGDRVTCTASLSGGAPGTYEWSGGSSSGSSSSYSTSFSSSGRHTVRLTVRNDGGSDDDSTEVTVVPPPNTHPERRGSISDITVNVDDDDYVDVRRYFRDPDGDSLSYSAESSRPSNVSVRSVRGDRVTVEGRRASSSATITVTADDGNGGTATQTFEVTVREEPPRVSISCTPRRPLLNESVTCTASLSGGSPDTYEWIGGVSDGSRPSYSPSFRSYGRQLVLLEVSNDGGSDDDSMYLDVLAVPPSSNYARCGSDNIKVYLFDRTNKRKHHLNMTGEEATSLFGRSWWNTIGHMAQRACDSWPTGTARTVADYR